MSRLLTVFLLFSALLLGCQPSGNSDKSQATLDTLHIQMDDAALQKIWKKVDKIEGRGGKRSGKKKYVPVMLGNVKADLRLEWAENDGWRFKIKTGKQAYWKGMQEFFVAVPEPKKSSEKWLYYHFLGQTNIITPRCHFVAVTINGSFQDTYLLEEDFSKLLVENNYYREGPILQYDGPEVTCFSSKSVLGSKTLAPQFLAGQTLLYQFQTGSQPLNQVFDQNSLAQYLAMVELSGNYSVLDPENQRWYYNPVTGLLQPIAFFSQNEATTATALTTHPEAARWLSDANLSALFTEKLAHLQAEESQYLFENPADAPELENVDLPVAEAAEKWSGERNQLLQSIAANPTNHTSVSPQFAERPFSKKEVLIYHWNQENQPQYQLANHSSAEIQLVGYLQNNQLVPVSNIPLAEACKQPFVPVERVIEVPADAKKWVYQVIGEDTVRVKSVIKHAPPAADTPMQRFKATAQNLKNLFPPTNGVISISGVHTFNSPIYAPAGLEVHIDAGTQLNFTDGAFLVSESPVQVNGTETNKVRIYTSDSTGRGILVSNVSKKSTWEHTTIENFNSFRIEGWQQTGAITFYQSEVGMRHVKLINNSCEDALNIIRSDFLLDQVSFERIYSDALDADFCTGQLMGCQFDRIGADAIDFSGCTVAVKNCTVSTCGDKGISAGEQSMVTVQLFTAKGARIGIAAKDLTEITVDEAQFKGCHYAYALFQKKPEYGPATITINDLDSAQLVWPVAIDKGSVLHLRDREIRGVKKLDIETLFY